MKVLPQKLFVVHLLLLDEEEEGCDFLAFFIEEESRNYKGDHKMGRPSLCSATLYLRRYVHTLQFIFGGVPLHLPVPLHVYIITHFGHFEV